MSKKCDYGSCLREEDIGAWEWRALLQLASEYDINRGGYCDGRIGAINFWCGPEDKPGDPNWDKFTIQKYALKYPRAYVGVVYGDFLEASSDDPNEKAIQQSSGWGGVWVNERPAKLGGKVRLHWVMSPYEKAAAMVNVANGHAADEFVDWPARYEGKRVHPEEFASAEDLDWCNTKFQELRNKIRNKDAER